MSDGVAHVPRFAAISGNPTGVVNIAGALKSGEITTAAQPQLEQALTLASSAMFTGVNQLSRSSACCPPGPRAQGPVNMATRVTGILESIFGNGTPTGETTGGMLSNLPIPTNLPVPCGLPIPKFLPFAKAC